MADMHIGPLISERQKALVLEFLAKGKNKDFMSLPMPNEPTAYGRQLYATLRRFDNGQYDRLLLEAPPNDPNWMAILDRLQRASFVPSRA